MPWIHLNMRFCSVDSLPAKVNKTLRMNSVSSTFATESSDTLLCARDWIKGSSELLQMIRAAPNKLDFNRPEI